MVVTEARKLWWPWWLGVGMATAGGLCAFFAETSRDALVLTISGVLGSILWAIAAWPRMPPGLPSIRERLNTPTSIRRTMITMIPWACAFLLSALLLSDRGFLPRLGLFFSMYVAFGAVALLIRSARSKSAPR